jgi:hypothetical protein
VTIGLSFTGHPPRHRPWTMTPPALREPPRGPLGPRGRPAPREPPPCEPSRSLQPSVVRESSAAPIRATPQEVALVAAERPLCPVNKNITYIK